MTQASANRRPVTQWLAMFASALLMPWLLVIGSVQFLERFYPGRVRTDDWKCFASVVFLLGVAAAAVLLLRTTRPLATRILLACVVALPGLWFALSFQMHSNCGAESSYVGQRPAGERVASCG